MYTEMMFVDVFFDSWKTNEYSIKTMLKCRRGNGEQIYTDNDEKDALKNR
jgi:hypothetical protein